MIEYGAVFLLTCRLQEATSVRLCRALGCSKSTFYQFFDSRDQFLREVFDELSGRLLQLVRIPAERCGRLEDDVDQLACAIRSSLTSEASLRLIRLAIAAQACGYDGLAKAFVGQMEYHRKIVAEYLVHYMGLGRLNIPDFDLAVRQFVDLTSGGLLDLFVSAGLSEESLSVCMDRTERNGVEIFLSAYRTSMGR